MTVFQHCWVAHVSSCAVEWFSLANLSPLYKHRSRNVISSVENSAVKLMRGCKSLMILMNCFFFRVSPH